MAGIWQATGIQWDPNTWYNLGMTVDYSTKTYDFSINGTQINTAPIPFYNAESDNFAQIRIFRGSNQSGMIVDDLTVAAVPEPGTLALLGVGGVALLFWRRRG